MVFSLTREKTGRMKKFPSWCPDLNVESTAMISGAFEQAGKQNNNKRWRPQTLSVIPVMATTQIRALGARTDSVARVINLDLLKIFPNFQDLVLNRDIAAAVLHTLETLSDAAIAMGIESTALVAKTLFSNQYGHHVPCNVNSLLADYNTFVSALKQIIHGGGCSNTEFCESHSSFYRELRVQAPGRVFITTAGGRIGMAGNCVQPGDQICIFFNLHSPFVLRRGNGINEWQFNGAAYIEGLMNGEIFDLRDFEHEGCDEFLIS